VHQHWYLFCAGLRATFPSLDAGSNDQSQPAEATQPSKEISHVGIERPGPPRWHKRDHTLRIALEGINRSQSAPLGIDGDGEAIAGFAYQREALF
jgi:hypothetical protein